MYSFEKVFKLSDKNILLSLYKNKITDTTLII